MASERQSLSELPVPHYSEEEREKILQYFMNLTGDLIREFLSSEEIPKSGTKPELKERIKTFLGEGQLEYKDLVNFLDTVTPFGKQHIILLDGPEEIIKQWRDYSYVKGLLEKNHISKYLNARLPLILPKTISLSSVEYVKGKLLKILAVERREYWERKKEEDQRKVEGGVEIELRAFLHQVARGIIIFSWDLVSNTAVLQISQLESNSKYQEMETKFAKMISSWLKFESFKKIDLNRIIRQLYDLELSGHPETRSHGIGLKTLGGGTISAHSSNQHSSIVGDPDLDSALDGIRRKGIGHLGNFFWLPNSIFPANNNPLEKELHTIIVRNEQRINFTTPNRGEDIEYVLSRVRALSK